MKLLQRPADDSGKTIVLALYDINVVSCYSDCLVAMRDGAVVHHGPPTEIMTGPVIRPVYDMDVEIQDIRGYKISNYFL